MFKTILIVLISVMIVHESVLGTNDDQLLVEKIIFGTDNLKKAEIETAVKEPDIDTKNIEDKNNANTNLEPDDKKKIDKKVVEDMNKTNNSTNKDDNKDKNEDKKTDGSSEGVAEESEDYDVNMFIPSIQYIHVEQNENNTTPLTILPTGCKNGFTKVEGKCRRVIRT